MFCSEEKDSLYRLRHPFISLLGQTHFEGCLSPGSIYIIRQRIVANFAEGCCGMSGWLGAECNRSRKTFYKEQITDRIVDEKLSAELLTVARVCVEWKWGTDADFDRYFELFGVEAVVTILTTLNNAAVLRFFVRQLARFVDSFVVVRGVASVFLNRKKELCLKSNLSYIRILLLCSSVTETVDGCIGIFDEEIVSDSLVVDVSDLTWLRD